MSKAAAETLFVVVERDVPFPPEKIWRALTQPHLIEEWLMKNDFAPVVGHLPGPRSRAEQNAILYLGGLWPRKRSHLDAHANGSRNPPAHGTVGLPA